LVEVDDEGRVLREIGLTAAGEQVHRMPSRAFRSGAYGFWDNQPMPLDIGTPLSQAEFEAAWVAGAEVEPQPHMRPRGFFDSLVSAVGARLFGTRRRLDK
jgi:hypothetical protein